MFSLNYHFLYWSPEGPLNVSCRSRTLRSLGDFQGTSLGRRVPARLVLISKNKIKGQSNCAICSTERTFFHKLEDKYDLQDELEIYLKFCLTEYYKTKHVNLLCKVWKKS